MLNSYVCKCFENSCLWNLFSWQSYNRGILPCHMAIIFCHSAQYINESAHFWIHTPIPINVFSPPPTLLHYTSHPPTSPPASCSTTNILGLFYFLLNCSLALPSSCPTACCEAAPSHILGLLPGCYHQVKKTPLFSDIQL